MTAHLRALAALAALLALVLVLGDPVPVPVGPGVGDRCPKVEVDLPHGGVVHRRQCGPEINP